MTNHIPAPACRPPAAPPRGVDGALTLEKDQAQLNLKLGFMLSAFAPMIEGKIADKMRKVFTESA